jgi:hypothetical protein
VTGILESPMLSGRGRTLGRALIDAIRGCCCFEQCLGLPTIEKPSRRSCLFMGDLSRPNSLLVPPTEESDRSPMIKLMCRLCEQWIPLSAVEQHSESCQRAYEACYRIKDLDRKLQKLDDIIVKQFLCGPWPGDKAEAIAQNFPLLHLRQILRQVISVDIDCDSAKRH